jgi:hypothetical protein
MNEGAGHRRLDLGNSECPRAGLRGAAIALLVPERSFVGTARTLMSLWMGSSESASMARLA